MAKRTESSTGEIELDLGRYELRRRGRAVKLEKKPMELLIFLVSRRDQLVSRAEIISKLWRSDLFIDPDTNVNNIVRKIRTALGDNRAKPRFLQTVVGKGYRLIGPIRVIDVRYAHSNDGQSGARAHHSRYDTFDNFKDHPSLAVLPLQVLGNPFDQDGWSLGFADAVIARLANLEQLNVLPLSSLINLRSEMPASEIGTRTGARFVVRGAIQTSKGQTRLSVELADLHSARNCFRRTFALDFARHSHVEEQVARLVASHLNRPLRPAPARPRKRYSHDAMAYADFMRGYRLSSSGDPAHLEEATERLGNAIQRDPSFALAHATLSSVCATRHFETDPASTLLEKAEFHCARALELDPDLPEGHVARAYLLWGPSKNFQHLDAIAELRRALALQSNLPHAYNRLGTILAHIGLLEHAREMYERGRNFDQRKAVSHSIVQVYIWNRDYDLAREEIKAWRSDSPGNKYPIYFAPQLAMMTGQSDEAHLLMEEALKLLPDDPLVISLQGLLHALTGDEERAMACLAQACAIPKSFGHAHHTYYQVACILALLGRRKPAFEWLERTVSSGFACWPYFLKDPCLESLRGMPEFEGLVNSLQAKYPDDLGLL